MKAISATVQNIEPGTDDHVVPFHVENLDVRGRAVQLGPMLNAILAGHNYPEPVLKLLAQTICLGVLLGSSLKFDGKFTIQIQGEGPISLLVADYTTPGTMRAYAGFDEEKLAALENPDTANPATLLGKGVMAMTIDPGSAARRYQGIVSLDGISLEDAAHQYFRQSEQIPTRVRLAVAQLLEKDPDGGTRTNWRAGGLIAQFLPNSPERVRVDDLPGGDDDEGKSDDIPEDDAWLEARSLVGTIGDDELTDPQINSESLLFRLFHESGVRVYPALQVINKCSCSKLKVTAIIKSFSDEERNEAFAASAIAGKISSKCEFCGSSYEIGMDDIGA